MTAVEIDRRNKIYTLIGILLAMFLGALDQTIVATSLPRIVSDLHGLSRYAWVATAYLMASTVLVPIYGKLADTHSRKTIELWAVSIFLSGSFLCGAAGEFGSFPLLGDGMSQLIIFRAVQGIGGAGLFAMAFIIIADLFPPAERAKYQGIVGSVFGVASVVGPLIGGFLTDYATGWIPHVEGWRWVFYVNLPIGIVALWFIISRMPRLEPKGERAGLNKLSALLLLLTLVPFILALQLDRRTYPWDGPVTLGLFAASLIMLILFVVHSHVDRNPIIDLSLFRNRVFTFANIALFFFGAGFLSTVIFLPLFMVNVLGVSATQAGVSIIPLSLGVMIGSFVAGQMVSRFGHYRRFMLAGGIVFLAGAILLSTMGISTQYWEVTLYMVVCGVGIGPTMPLFPLAIQNSVSFQNIGQATSASQFFRQIGGTVGTAVMGTVLATTLAAAFAHIPGSAGFAASAATAHGAVEPALVKAAFATAITRIYTYLIFILVLGIIATLFVPELPLRKTHGAPPAADVGEV
ncbi:MAG TPA: MDR family MFS transporter [Spirochaetia bacterium]|nr:MDR family MFS transporter [Spirochaetia bacterium]